MTQFNDRPNFDGQDRNYTRIGGISATLLINMGMEAMFPGSHGHLAEIKEASKLVDAVCKGTSPLDEYFRANRSSMEAKVQGLANAAIIALKNSKRASLPEAEKKRLRKVAMKGFLEAHASVSDVDVKLNQKAELAKYVALCHMAMGHIESSKDWFEQALKDYDILLNMKPEEYGALEKVAVADSFRHPDVPRFTKSMKLGGGTGGGLGHLMLKAVLLPATHKSRKATDERNERLLLEQRKARTSKAALQAILMLY